MACNCVCVFVTPLFYGQRKRHWTVIAHWNESTNFYQILVAYFLRKFRIVQEKT